MLRRDLLRLAVTSAVIGPRLFDSALARALTIPAHRRTGTMMDVEHIVVFMQENRSFDHYFGTLAGVRGLADPHPAPLPNGNPTWVQMGLDGREVRPFHFDVHNTSFPVMKSLPHDVATGREAWNDGRYDRWVDAKGSLTMGYLRREDIPYHMALADAFTVCDAYYSSLFGPTCPNRIFMMTGGNDPAGTGGGPVTGCDNITQVPLGTKIYGSAWRTYPEQLQAAGISWQTYRQGADPYSDDNSDGGMNPLLAFRSFIEAKPGDPLYERGVRPRRLEQLKADVQHDRLAQISWIFPPRIFCEHPKWPPSFGVEYIGRVLDALTSNPEVWSKTALFLMYDENDGFFDHVPPPSPPLSRNEGLSTVPTHLERDPDTGKPFGLGPRVPMLVISPWSRGGFVCSETFDHTSTIKFMEARFGVRCDNITPWRRTVVGDLTSAFDFAKPDGSSIEVDRINADLKLPDQADFEKFRAIYVAKPKPAAPGHPNPVEVEQGMRRSRPLGYRFKVTDEAAAGGTRLTFQNEGEPGTTFTVYDRLHPDRVPRQYTVGAGETISDFWRHASGTDLVVHGPNSFVRGFRNSASVKMRCDIIEKKGVASLQITISNQDESSQYIELCHTKTRERVAISPGARRVWNIAAKDDATYDIRIIGDDFERLAAGRLEVEQHVDRPNDLACGSTTRSVARQT